MLSAIVYVGFAAIEAFCVIFFTLAVARVDIKGYIKEITLGIIIISISTYMFKEVYILSDLSSMLSVIMLLLIVVLIFRFSLIHSFIIVAVSYLACFILQGVLWYIPTVFSSFTFNDIKNTDVLRYSVQTINSVLIFLGSLKLKKMGVGFTFLPYEKSIKFKITKTNMNIVYLFIVLILITGSVLEMDHMIIGIFLLIVLFNFSLFMGLRREKGRIKFD